MKIMMQNYGVLFIAVSLLVGCAMFDLDGNGKFDPIAYLESADISVAWIGPDGTPYTIAMDENGLRIEGKLVDAHGNTYSLSRVGGFEVTSPSGLVLKIQRD